EDTFAEDLPLADLEPPIRDLTAKVWASPRKVERAGRTIVLMLKTRDFRILTRSTSPASTPDGADELATIALALRERVLLPPTTRYRLVGVGISNFVEADELGAQGGLFAD